MTMQNRTAWPTRHISLIEDNWGTTTIAELAEQTGRSKESVRRLARKIGLPLLRPRKHCNGAPTVRARVLASAAQRYGVTLPRLKYLEGEL